MQKTMVSPCPAPVPARGLTVALALTLAAILMPCMAGPGAAQAPFGADLLPGEAVPVPVALPAPGAWAEGVYAEYSAGTGHRVSFEVETLDAGRLAALAGKRFGDLVAAPEELLVASQFGTHLRNPRFVGAFDGGIDLTGLADLDAAIDRFEEVGYPLALGRYRTLRVTTTLGAVAREHRAMELCWDSLGHCVVYDPAVVFLQSMVDNRVRLAAEGWGPRILQEKNPDAPNGPRTKATTAAVCGLASNPGVKDRSYYWGGYWVEYRNVFGITLVRKDLGAQRSGIRCDVNCNPQPYGYSNASSCYGTFGWNCACDNAFGYGTGGSSGKWIAETKCTHQFLISARASASVTDLGSIAVDIYWEMEGGEDANGGQIIDTCGYF